MLWVPVCNMAKDPGPCEADYPMWHFEPATKMCQEFVYGGCDGNANRFSSRLECENKCRDLMQKEVGQSHPYAWHSFQL